MEINQNNEEEQLRGELLRILYQKKIKTVFQPIVSLHWMPRFMVMKPLSRGPDDSPLQTPDQAL